jgi:hypothetical protein
MKAINILILLPLLLSSCVFISSHVMPLDVSKDTTEHRINKTTRINLYDGSIIIYSDGCRITRDSLYGPGLKYDYTLQLQDSVYSISRNNISNVQYYEKRWQYLTTIVIIPVIAILTFAILLAAALSGTNI